MSDDLVLISRLLIGEVRRLEGVVRLLEVGQMPDRVSPEEAIRMLDRAKNKAPSSDPVREAYEAWKKARADEKAQKA